MARIASFVAGAVLALVLAGGGCGGGKDRAAGVMVPLVAPDTLAGWVASGRVVLFDIQPDSLYERARLPMAVPARGATVTGLRELIPVDPDIPLVVYNTDGSTPPPGEDLADQMSEYGFPHVYWLEGGLDAWVARGYDVSGSRVFPNR